MFEIKNSAMNIKDVETPEQIEALCLEYIQEIEENAGVSNQRTRAINGQDAFRGNLWTQEQYNAYKSLGVEPISVNRCRPVIKILCGLYLQNKQEVTVAPYQGGSATVARVWTQILKHTQDLGKVEFMLFELFRLGNIETAAYIWTDIDKKRNPNGQLIYSTEGYFSTIVDPECLSYDLSDPEVGARFVIKIRYIDTNVMDARYPDKADAFSTGASISLRGGMGDVNSIVSSLVGRQQQLGISTEYEHRYCVYEVWWRKPIEGLAVYDKKKRTIKTLTDKSLITKAKKAAKSSKRYVAEPVVAFEFHKTVMVGKVFAEDVANPTGDITDYPCHKYVPFFDKGYEDSILTDCIGLNKEEENSRTQAIRIINQTANGGWIVGSDSDKEAMAMLAKYGAVAGIVLGLNRFGGKLEKIQPNQLPQGEIWNAQRSAEDIKEITGTNEALRGEADQKNQSGVAINAKIHQGITSNEMIFDNFATTLELFGNYQLKLIQEMDIYTPEEIRLIVAQSDMLDKKFLQQAEDNLTNTIGGTLPQPSIPQPKPDMFNNIPPEQQEEIYQQVSMGIKGAQMYAEKYPMLKDTWDKVIKEHAVNLLIAEMDKSETAEYKVKVIVSPSSPTARMAEYAKLADISARHPGLVPPDIEIEMADISKGEEIIDRLKQAAAQPPVMPTQGRPQPAMAGAM